MICQRFPPSARFLPLVSPQGCEAAGYVSIVLALSSVPDIRQSAEAPNQSH